MNPVGNHSALETLGVNKQLAERFKDRPEELSKLLKKFGTLQSAQLAPDKNPGDSQAIEEFKVIQEALAAIEPSDETDNKYSALNTAVEEHLAAPATQIERIRGLFQAGFEQKKNQVDILSKQLGKFLDQMISGSVLYAASEAKDFRFPVSFDLFDNYVKDGNFLESEESFDLNSAKKCFELCSSNNVLTFHRLKKALESVPYNEFIKYEAKENELLLYPAKVQQGEIKKLQRTNHPETHDMKIIGFLPLSSLMSRQGLFHSNDSKNSGSLADSSSASEATQKQARQSLIQKVSVDGMSQDEFLNYFQDLKADTDFVGSKDEAEFVVGLRKDNDGQLRFVLLGSLLPQIDKESFRADGNIAFQARRAAAPKKSSAQDFSNQVLMHEIDISKREKVKDFISNIPVAIRDELLDPNASKNLVLGDYTDVDNLSQQYIRSIGAHRNLLEKAVVNIIAESFSLSNLGPSTSDRMGELSRRVGAYYIKLNAIDALKNEGLDLILSAINQVSADEESKANEKTAINALIEAVAKDPSGPLEPESAKRFIEHSFYSELLEVRDFGGYKLNDTTVANRNPTIYNSILHSDLEALREALAEITHVIDRDGKVLAELPSRVGEKLKTCLVTDDIYLPDIIASFKKKGGADIKRVFLDFPEIAKALKNKALAKKTS